MSFHRATVPRVRNSCEPEGYMEYDDEGVIWKLDGVVGLGTELKRDRGLLKYYVLTVGNAAGG